MKKYVFTIMFETLTDVELIYLVFHLNLAVYRKIVQLIIEIKYMLVEKQRIQPHMKLTENGFFPISQSAYAAHACPIMAGILTLIGFIL